jgi:hypothetical protein
MYAIIYVIIYTCELYNIYIYVICIYFGRVEVQDQHYLVFGEPVYIYIYIYIYIYKYVCLCVCIHIHT